MPKSSQALVETPHHGDDDEDELDLEEGDVVTVLLKRDSHWWIGQLEEERGLFPANNVKEIKGIVPLYTCYCCYQMIEHFLNTCQSDTLDQMLYVPSFDLVEADPMYTSDKTSHFY